MRIQDTVQTSARGITVNKTRSALTMLGIVIGVASVVLMVSIGRSFQGYIMDLIASIGTNTMDVFPKGLEQFGGSLDSLTYEDYEAIKRLSTVENVTPVIIVAKTVTYGREEKNPLVFGTHKEFFANYSLKLADGRLLEQSDEDGAKSVAVISNQTAIDLFGNQNPLGKKVKVGEQSFTIVGLLQPQESLLMSDLDKPLYLPFSSAKALTGQKYLSYINLKTKGNQEIAQQDVELLLRQRHRIDNPEGDSAKDDFAARGAEQVSSIVNSVTLGLTVFLSLIAGISLLVGGIGIMNIMLVSVTERTREIGLRKAVGAKRRDILLQFLLEAVSLTLTGGIAGILIGGTLAWILVSLASAFLGPMPFSLSIPSILLAVGMAVGTGLLFGIYPARKAASLSPMEALRFE